ncbi:MAG: DUF2264 domain-containing protein [bacterium]|nr:DUF2264 domain-containing protein [bacterium]
MSNGEQRKIWLEAMDKIAAPVLSHLAEGSLKSSLPLEFHSERKNFAPLEAFGRTALGVAPWLEVENLSGEEAELQKKYREQMLRCLDMATDPNSPDYMDFADTGEQPLVDTAFLCHAIVRAPKQMGQKMDERVKANLIAALKKTRRVHPHGSNWLFFTAMVETALYLLGDPEWDKMRIDYASYLFDVWYKGDGVYGDGEHFHWDYYNSFVIQPMYVDICRTLAPICPDYAKRLPEAEKRMARYASVLERMIASDGSYPIVGRSIAYRFGAFHALAQVALQHKLEEHLTPAGVRCALTAVIQKVMQAEGMFDENGWLRPGVYGYQPELAETYINIGSLYLCSAVFLPLGLQPDDAFWADADASWSAKTVWEGGHITIDHAID